MLNPVAQPASVKMSMKLFDLIHRISTPALLRWRQQ
jgi:hypothetical protein